MKVRQEGMYTGVSQSAGEHFVRGIKNLRPKKRSSGCFNHEIAFPEHSFALKKLNNFQNEQVGLEKILFPVQIV